MDIGIMMEKYNFGFPRRNMWLGAVVGMAVGLGLVTNMEAALASSSVPGALEEDQQKKPNILFILVDDLGWRDLSSYGSDFYESPNIDKLASEGMRFTAAYASSPVCSPTRAAILTGKHPARVNITDWIPGDDPKNKKLIGARDLDQLPLEEETIAEVLKKAGYKTFFAGKWHLGGEAYYPEKQGFDQNIGGIHMGQPPGGYYSPYQNPRLADGPEGEYLTDRLTSEALSFMADNATQEAPFFLYLPYYTVHTPIQASKRHVAKFEKKLVENPNPEGPDQRPEHTGLNKQFQDNTDYASMIYAMDENVGRLMAGLKKYGLDKNTIVVFTSDNGGRSTLYEPEYGPGHPTSNLPLRAGKGWLYEGGVRVPLVLKTPDMQKGSVSDQPVVSTDFMPTLLELAGVAFDKSSYPDGVSLEPLLEGNKSLEREDLFFYFPHYHGSASIPSASVRSGDWKLIEFLETGAVELYNLKEDIGETTDLSRKHADKVQELKAKLVLWLDEVDAVRPTANRNFKASP
ncbi:sulfatase [Paremcibacter congregatus]|uniref:sulfatase n=1 Tax=Paremcibacter congregatus TaxID=2043170 RepID=UPI003A9163B2